MQIPPPPPIHCFAEFGLDGFNRQAHNLKYTIEANSSHALTSLPVVKVMVQAHTRCCNSQPLAGTVGAANEFVFKQQCCVTRVQCFSLWLGLGLRNRDSGPSHARIQAVVAVLCCAVYSDIRYILLFVFMFWKINKCWICGLLDSWLGLENFFWLGLGLWGENSDSDFEVMTRTRIWQPGLGHSTVKQRAHCQGVAR